MDFISYLSILLIILFFIVIVVDIAFCLVMNYITKETVVDMVDKNLFIIRKDVFLSPDIMIFLNDRIYPEGMVFPQYVITSKERGVEQVDKTFFSSVSIGKNIVKEKHIKKKLIIPLVVMVMDKKERHLIQEDIVMVVNE